MFTFIGCGFSHLSSSKSQCNHNLNNPELSNQQNKEKTKKKPVSITNSANENTNDTKTRPLMKNFDPVIDDKLSEKDQLFKTQLLLDEALELCQAAQDFWQKGDLENALTTLDNSYSLILKINSYDNPKLIQEKEDLRFMISKRILEIYASRHTVASGNHNAIPITMNKHIKAEMKIMTQSKEKKFFISAYKRSGRYRAKIVQELKKAGLPLELSWLPLVESAFKVKALSKARALGLWQFIPSTGYKFGLKRNIYIDERLDPFKSTKAAIAYLTELHQIFGDWTTVLAAYNCGEGRVLRLIREQNINYLDHFWDLHERLPRETARYVPKFIATLHIINNLKENGLDTITLDEPLEYEEVEITKHVCLKDIASEIEVPLKNLLQLNPELRYKVLPNDKYLLKVPPGFSTILIAKLDKIPVYSLPKRSYVRHRVRHGETLSAIARKYKANIFQIAKANKIHKNNYIVAGKLLKIPLTKTTLHKPNRFKSTISNKKNYTPSHIVKRGDSLWILARRYNTTTRKIQFINNMASTTLYIGQEINIPGAKKNIMGRYQVKQGDSPFLIAMKHSMSLKRFLRINNLTPKSTIYPGQTLVIQ